MSSQSKATDIVKTRLQVQVKEDEESASVEESTRSEDPHYASTMDAITRIMNDEGVKGLYAGIGGSLIGVASTNFAYFYWYSVVRNVYVKSHRSSQHPSTVVELSLGAIAGAIAQLLLGAMSKALATIMTQPLIVAKVMKFIISKEGYFGLFKGIGPQILKGLLVQGILMTTKERMELMFILMLRYLRRVKTGSVSTIAKSA
ncbi:Mitochondrial substrate carrier family protein Q [Ceratocystis platani]|uniref:Mitochondrial substrate carrier family protein Q n=1 Tax=Ceratocystis fimbriata f. sp. platani TaxID=88771 RepID=A0A0F8CUQ4_CERFI|nr:Mitochondrial substrate carrier family protein Q [Ceratocystis platani]